MSRAPRLPRRPRILLYSHDSYGLGHLRRSLAIARQLALDLPQASQLLLTGSMVAGAFDLPPNLDLVKLPALSKHTNGRYKTRALPLSLAQTLAWRAQMILQATVAFQPDLVLADKTPAGIQGELLPTLRYLHTWRPKTRLVLGMRDIEDEPHITCAEWTASGARQLHEEVYDRLLLYGQRDIFDPIHEYTMSPVSAAKLVACGYLGNAKPARSREAVRRELDAGDRPLIVVTAGGGGDGFDLLKAYLDALSLDSALSRRHSLVVTGPLMSGSKRNLLHNAARQGHLQLLEFTPDLVSYIAAADLVVSMAGYNTVCEVLSLGVRALLVPRVKPRLEQRLRAERLAERGLVRMLPPELLAPGRLAAEIEAALTLPPPRVTLDLGGLARTSQALINVLENGNSNSRSPSPQVTHLQGDQGSMPRWPELAPHQAI